MIWGVRFRKYLGVHPNDVAGAVDAEWRRLQRGEPSHWLEQGWEDE